MQHAPESLSKLALSTLAGLVLCSSPRLALAGECGSLGPDLLPARIASVGNYGLDAGLDAVAFGFDVCNVGDAPLAVQASTPQHYLVTQNLYRLQDRGGWWAFEQVGLGWVFHSFCALAQSICCSCSGTTGCNSLQPGCSSPDSASTAGSASFLGPRAEIDPFSGQFPVPYANPPLASANYRRVAVLPADLESTLATSTRYFAELVGVAPEDAAAGNTANNAAWRELSAVPSGGGASFGLLGATTAGEAALHAWRAADPAVEIRAIQLAGEGRLLLASRVTDLGGTWHYEYALFNLDSQDAIGSFALPLAAGLTVSNQGFHDVTYRGGDGLGGIDRDDTDWEQKQEAGLLVWSTSPFAQHPNANALRWGTLYNFRFDADAPPTTGSLRLGRFESGLFELVPGVPVPASPVAPGLSFCTDTDFGHLMCPCGNAGLPGHGCDNAQGTGGVSLTATLFAPNGLGGGSATFVAQGFPPASTPGAVLMRALAQDPTPPIFGDGVRCLELAGLVRVAAGAAQGGALTLAVNHGAGAGTFAYQLWYRNLPAAYCTPAGFNLSSGYELVW